MSVEFSAKISMLRKEKNITQKQAAADLQISQALLSHYEKGIRECSLDFVKRAARYYGVSADYLLGLTDMKHAGGNLLDASDIDSDDEMSMRTLLRALLHLHTEAESDREETADFFRDYFSLSVRRYVDWTNGAPESERRRAELCEALLALRRQQTGGKTEKSEPSQAVRTVTAHAEACEAQTLTAANTNN